MTEEEEKQPVGSHHGDPTLTRRDIWILESQNKWICTAIAAGAFKPGKLPHHPDWIKSRLFWRIRSGKEPLKYPPPTCYSCPWYEVIEIEGPHSSGDTIREFEREPGKKQASFNQCLYDILGVDGDKWVLGFGPYRFLAWNGDVKWVGREPKYDVLRPGAWIQFTGTEEGNRPMAKEKGKVGSWIVIVKCEVTKEIFCDGCTEEEARNETFEFSVGEKVIDQQNFKVTNVNPNN